MLHCTGHYKFTEKIVLLDDVVKKRTSFFKKKMKISLFYYVSPQDVYHTGTGVT